MKTEAVPQHLSYQNTNRQTIFQSFMIWSNNQQSSRLAFLAAMLMVHGNITAPLALYSMYLADGGLLQLSLITLCSFSILVVNLAALPTKITIPVFVASTLSLLLLIITNFIVAF